MCFKNNHDKANMEIFINLFSCCKICRIICRIGMGFWRSVCHVKNWTYCEWTTVVAWLDGFLKRLIWLSCQKTSFPPISSNAWTLLLSNPLLFFRWNTERYIIQLNQIRTNTAQVIIGNFWCIKIQPKRTDLSTRPRAITTDRVCGVYSRGLVLICFFRGWALINRPWAFERAKGTC